MVPSFCMDMTVPPITLLGPLLYSSEYTLTVYPAADVRGGFGTRELRERGGAIHATSLDS